MSKAEHEWQASVAPAPVWRDGLTTKMSYAIIAGHQKAQGYSCVCVRPIGSHENKVKFYPDLATWGLTQTELSQLGLGHFLDRTDDDATHYFRAYANTEALEALIDRLEGTRNVTAITKVMLTDVYAGKGKEQRLHAPGVRIPVA